MFGEGENDIEQQTRLLNDRSANCGITDDTNTEDLSLEGSKATGSSAGDDTQHWISSNGIGHDSGRTQEPDEALEQPQMHQGITLTTKLNSDSLTELEVQELKRFIPEISDYRLGKSMASRKPRIKGKGYPSHYGNDSSDESKDFDDTRSVWSSDFGDEDLDGNEEVLKTAKLSEDTFSFLITNPVCSTPFAMSMFVVFLKTVIYSLILANMLDKGTSRNPLAIPASTSWPVIVTQIFAVFITVITQDDLITALRLIHDGYDKNNLHNAFQHCRFWKWSMAVALLTSIGVYGLWVTFMLIVRSEDVVNLILNFTAIEFIR